MFNVPRVDFTAQAATEKKRKMSKVSDLLAQFWTDPNLGFSKKTTTIWGECALWWSHVSKRQFCNQNELPLKCWEKKQNNWCRERFRGNQGNCSLHVGMNGDVSQPCDVLKKLRLSELNKKFAPSPPKAGGEDEELRDVQGLQTARIWAHNVKKLLWPDAILQWHFLKQLRAGININIYAHKLRLKVYITAEKYMSEISHCLQKTIKLDELKHNLIVKHRNPAPFNMWPRAVITTPCDVVACLCGFTVFCVSVKTEIQCEVRQH